MKPCCEMDRVIGGYIENHFGNDFCDILSEDERLETASYLSELANGLLGWYPFETNKTVLQIGSWFGAFSEMLGTRCKSVTIVEKDSYRTAMTGKRLKSFDNIQVLNESIMDYCKVSIVKFDYVVFVVDEYIDVIPDKESYFELLNQAKTVLNSEGKLLFAVPNRLGVKYFCGEPDPNTKVRFDGITESNSGLYRFDRKELLDFMNDLGFSYIKLYYPMPEHRHTQVIYTDHNRPEESIVERLNIYQSNKTKRLLDEWRLVENLAQNNVLHCFCNSFLVEAGWNSGSEVIYSAISAERSRTRAFATNIYHHRVEKVPLYPEGRIGLKQLFDHTSELKSRGIPVLDMEDRDGKAVMERIQYPSLAQYLRDTIKHDPTLCIEIIDRLRDYIWKSSEHAEAATNCMSESALDENWGVILKKAYIEMIPVNSFYKDGDILFYDQEFIRENCPANYVLFRALKDLYRFSPEFEKMIPLDSLKKRYGLVSTWDFYAEEEEKFQTELRRRNIYSGFFHWIRYLIGTVPKIRRQLDTEESDRNDCFNPVSDLDARRIILFGAGKRAEDYLDKYGEEFPPLYMADNNSDKWGNKKKGIEIKGPNEIARLMPGTYRVIIAVKDYEPIVRQLEKMGIGEDSYRIFDKKIDSLLEMKLSNSMPDNKYLIGYVEDVFEQPYSKYFHLLDNCKSRSHYLIAGVFTDELIQQKKGKKPDIPFEERVEIVRQCKYVDKVILVDSYNADEIYMWKELKYDCLFTGNEHRNQPYWLWMQKQLRTLGSNLEFLPLYKKNTNMLKGKMTE